MLAYGTGDVGDSTLQQLQLGHVTGQMFSVFKQLPLVPHVASSCWLQLPLGDLGSGPATCFLGHSPRCICSTSALLLPLVTKGNLGPCFESRPYGLGTFVLSNVPMT